MVASKMAPQWPSLLGIHALVRLPPKMYQGWHVWLIERGRSAGVSLPKLGRRRHCRSALLTVRSCALKEASRVEHTQAALWRGFTGKEPRPPANSQPQLASHMRESFWKQSLWSQSSLDMITVPADISAATSWDTKPTTQLSCSEFLTHRDCVR